MSRKEHSGNFAITPRLSPCTTRFGPSGIRLDELHLGNATDAPRVGTNGEQIGVGPWRVSGPPTRATTPSCWSTATRATWSTGTGSGPWRAIVADLDARVEHPFHVAIENWQHDLNIGSIVRKRPRVPRSR